jgi:hypothetical protein
MSNTTRRPFAIVDSAPAPQDVFVLEGYCVLANAAGSQTETIIYNQNPALLTETYTQGTGETFTPDAQPLLIDPGVAVLNVTLDTVAGGALTSTGAATLQVGTLNALGTDLNQTFGVASAYTAVNTGVVVPSTTVVNIVNTDANTGKLYIKVAGEALTLGGTVRVRLVCTRA